MINFDQHVRYFVCCANIGMGAHLSRKANGGIRRKLGDFCGTFISLVGLLSTFQPFNLEVVQQHEATLLSKMINLSVGITPYIASGIKVHRESHPGKGMFYLLTVRDLNWFRAVKLISKIYSGKPFANSSYLNLNYSDWLQINSPFSVEVEADGDPIGYLPCHISMAQSLPLLVPREHVGD